MNIIYNDQPLTLPKDNMTLEELAEWKELPKQGTAIAVNDKLIKRDKWPVFNLKELDRVTVITAAFGG